MKEKLIITAEISKSAISTLFFLSGEELTQERWEKLSESPISLDLGVLGKSERMQLEMLLASCTILSKKAE